MKDDVLPPWLREPLALALKQRAHALLIHGAAGAGLLDLGIALVRASLCEGEGAPKPCETCPACRLAQSRSHPDFLALLPEAMAESLGWREGAEADAAKQRTKPSREIRVDAVRDAIEWAQQTASRGGSKWLLIHPAEAMNAIAANALLKTLEEPPASLRLVLLASDPALLLPTIRSRCQQLRVTAPARPQALAWLQRQRIEDAEAMLDAAGGQPLDALALARDGIDAGQWSALPRRVARGDAGAFAGWPTPRVIQTLQKLCHDAMAVSAGAAPRYFGAAMLPPRADLGALGAWSKSLADIARRDEHPWHAALLVEALVIEAQTALRCAPLVTLAA